MLDMSLKQRLSPMLKGTIIIVGWMIGLLKIFYCNNLKDGCEKMGFDFVKRLS